MYDFNNIVIANSLFLLHKQHPGSHPSSHGSSQYWSIFWFTLRNFLLLHWWRWHIPFEVILRSVPFSYVSPSYLQPWDPKNNQANYIFKPINDLLLNFSQVLVYIRSNVKECDWSIRRETEIYIDLICRNRLLPNCFLPLFEKRVFVQKSFLKMSLICTKMNVKIKHLFIWIALL